MTDESDTLVRLPLLGRLSYREWHALVDGVYCGAIGAQVNEYGQEKHYWRAGWLVGDAYRQLRDRES
jgi:hypothetical protein